MARLFALLRLQTLQPNTRTLQWSSSYNAAPKEEILFKLRKKTSQNSDSFVFILANVKTMRFDISNVLLQSHSLNNEEKAVSTQLNKWALIPLWL
jgi:hypothetical protein